MNKLFGFSDSTPQSAVVVKKESDKKGEQPPSSCTAMDIRVALANAKGSSGRRVGLQPIKIWLWYATQNVSSAASTQAPTNGVRPSTSSEFSSLAALYDEYRALAVRRHIALLTTTNIAPVDYCEAYDPTNSAAYGSVTAVLSAPLRFPPMHATAVGGVSPLSVSRTGFQTADFKIPSGVVANSAAASVGDTWVSTATTAVDFGWLKAYVAAPSSGTTTLDGYIGILTEFRVRT
jgi:hypothetical protein